MKVDIEKAATLLSDGEVVAFPTETVYGLGGDAWNPSAVRKVFEIKGRPADNPLIVHLPSQELAETFTDDIPAKARELMDRYWPGPLTLILRKKPEVLDLITGGLDTVALRWPDHPLSQQLIGKVGPLVAPSANKSGRPSPTRAEHVEEDFGEAFPVIDGGATQIGLESTVLDVSDRPFVIYRPGAVGREEIERTIGEAVDVNEEAGEKDDTRSPGTRYSHYSPAARVRWMDEDEDERVFSDDTLYLLHTGLRDGTGDGGNIVRFNADYKRLANELFDRFRQADHEGFSCIVIEPFRETDEPIVRALQNRINKAIG